MKYPNPTSAMIAHAITVYTQDEQLKSSFHQYRWKAAERNLTDWGLLHSHNTRAEK